MLHLDEASHGPHDFDFGPSEASLFVGDWWEPERLPQATELVELEAALTRDVEPGELGLPDECLRKGAAGFPRFHRRAHVTRGRPRRVRHASRGTDASSSSTCIEISLGAGVRHASVPRAVTTTRCPCEPEVVISR